MFSEDVVGLVEEMGFQPSSELSLTDGCCAEVERKEGHSRSAVRCVTTYVGITSAIGQPTRPTQPFILQGSINE